MLFPKTVAEGSILKPTFTLLSVTAGLIALDPTISHPLRRTRALNGFDTVFSGRNTSIGMAAFPFAFYMYGLARKSTPAQHTFLLAGEAVIDSEILTSVFKDIDRRLRPNQLPPKRRLQRQLVPCTRPPSWGYRIFPLRTHDRGVLHSYCLC